MGVVYSFLLRQQGGNCGYDSNVAMREKKKILALGHYPKISLADARERRDGARKLLAHGIDPGAVRKAQKQAEIEEVETFGVIARGWLHKYKLKQQWNVKDDDLVDYITA